MNALLNLAFFLLSFLSFKAAQTNFFYMERFFFNKTYSLQWTTILFFTQEQNKRMENRYQFINAPMTVRFIYAILTIFASVILPVYVIDFGNISRYGATGWF